MTRPALLLLLALLAVGCSARPGVRPVAPPPAPPPVVTDPADLWGDQARPNVELLAAANEARSQHGRPALRFDNRLAAAARLIAMDNAAAGRLGHAGNDGSDPWGRIRAAGFPAVRASENAFACPPWPAGPADWGSAAHAVRGWLGSTVGHRQNLLGDWSHAGGAVATGKDGTVYWFQCYGQLAKP
jgi:uncharacterized protein YkwD